eukprot:7425979-Lingulodinium_polyedra.AAC.1
MHLVFERRRRVLCLCGKLRARRPRRSALARWRAAGVFSHAGGPLVRPRVLVGRRFVVACRQVAGSCSHAGGP